MVVPGARGRKCSMTFLPAGHGAGVCLRPRALQLPRHPASVPPRPECPAGQGSSSFLFGPQHRSSAQHPVALSFCRTEFLHVSCTHNQALVPQTEQRAGHAESRLLGANLEPAVCRVGRFACMTSLDFHSHAGGSSGHCPPSTGGDPGTARPAGRGWPS